MGKKPRIFPTETPARSEELLARRFLAEDRETVTQVRGIVTRMVRFRGYGLPEGDREDVVQETLLQIWEAVRQPQFDPTRRFESFVQTVAARRCIDRMRTHRTIVPLNPGLPHGAAGPLGNLMRSERVELARKVLDRLKETCLELIRLHVAEKKTYGQIAEDLGRSEGALRVQMHQCIRDARKILDGMLRDDGPGREKAREK